MWRNRWSIVVVLLAVACFADRAVLAAPALPPQAAQIAQRAVSRFTVRFCRTVATLRLVTPRSTAHSPQPIASPTPVAVWRPALLTFAQRSLPPPAL